MEEIDIIELLKRAKEGKAPKKIEIDDTIYHFTNGEDISTMYTDADSCDWLTEELVTTKTKIKILDKPIIEELEIWQDEDGKEKAIVYPINDGTNNYNKNYSVCDLYIANKINEIIRYIKKESEEK